MDATKGFICEVKAAATRSLVLRNVLSGGTTSAGAVTVYLYGVKLS